MSGSRTVRKRCWRCWTSRKSNGNMVQVYLAEIPDKKCGVKEQSKWARRLLNKALKIQYPEICEPVLLERDSKGKPFLLRYSNIHINLSHSGGYVACAIGKKPVGVDIQCWKKRGKQELVIKKFHPEEQKALQMADEAKRRLLFHELWVLKESFIKAEGSGLGIPLDSFYTEEIGEGKGRVLQKQNNKNYYYKLYPVRDRDFSLAACSEEEDFMREPVWLAL